MQFRKITIVGVGLLGGSIGLAARQRRLAGEVAGFVRRAVSLKDCEKAGAVDFATTDLLAAVSNADLIILGSHGTSGIKRILIGSVSENTALHAPCSVEVIR